MLNRQDEAAEPLNALEAEQALLGAALHNNQVLVLLREKIGPEHFYAPVHSRLWEAMLEEIDLGRNACYFTLAPRFRHDVTIGELGGVAYIAGLYRSVVTVVNAPGYADKIIETYRVRRGIELSNRLAEAIEGEDPDEVAAARKELADFYDGVARKKSPRVHIADVAGTVVDDLNQVYMTGKKPDDGAEWGLEDMRRTLGLAKRGCLYVLAGRPAMGKSAVAESIAVKMARKFSVLYFSLEMSKEQLTRRALCDISYRHSDPIQYQKLENFEVTAPQLERLIEAQQQFRTLNFQIDERAGLKVEEIRAAATREKIRLEAAGKRLDVVIVDHMGIMGVNDRYKGNSVNELGEISGGLKVMAKELDCAVIALMQLNRGVEYRDNKRPGLADLRGSGAIEQDADVVMFVYRESYYLEREKSSNPMEEVDRKTKLNEVRNVIEIDVAKNRHGACFPMKFYCDMGSCAIRDLANHGPMELL